MFRRRNLMFGVGWLGVATLACRDGSNPTVPFDLVEVMRYGANEPTAFFAGDEFAATGGDVLADIPAVARDSAGILYVLDRDWKKVIAFAPDGTPQPRIFGGAGEGPGEFRVPVHLTLTSSGAVSVLDYQLQRVTWFERGVLTRTIPLPSAGVRRHMMLGDSIVVTEARESTRPIVTVYGLDGAVMNQGPVLSPEDQLFGPAMGLAGGPNGMILVSTRQPGVWMERRGQEWHRIGLPLYPDQMPPTEEVTGPRMIRVTPAQADAGSIALYGDSLVVQGYLRFRRPFSWEDPPARDEIDRFLAFFRLDGTHSTTVALPSGVVNECLYVDPQTDHIFLCTTQPFPQVIEYTIRW